MGISVWQLLIILAIVLVLFGAKRLRNLGGDLGTAVKGFKNAVKEGDEEVNKEQLEDQAEEDRTIEGESTREKDKV
ncbi:Sec-independent protein translocase subunit TatA [Thiohalobacter thiocyanaticus]|uniref:Sec-independent protein translocase protein TatA n=1 Tax=Thiohalobacter thiocyanaticus TaxID=585455 RepID=A0A426QJ91_9GAMM|nr:Sec-independent protein translocase subunit TatA [Thiohalobacter thiocyanaticus]RRQ21815.1 Sec-independent protein translocase subunit TatA [Thiohalobacter thiocyanaticus]